LTVADDDTTTTRGGSPWTTMSSCTWGAAAHAESPSWSASTKQVPPPVKRTVVPLTEHAPGAEAASTENVTGRPDVEVAATL
jgi:hypothetical protein